MLLASQNPLLSQRSGMKPKQVAPWIRCASCGAPNNVEERHFTAYFEDKKFDCTSCNKSFKFWEVALREVQENFMLSQAFSLIFAKQTVFKVYLKPNTTAHYKIEDHGIPSDAQILHVNYTPHGNLIPLEIHGNVATLRRARDTVYLWPMPPRDGKNPVDTEVGCFITWVPSSELTDSWKNLVQALEMYAAAEYPSAIVPANVAVESMLFAILRAYLPKHIGTGKAQDFLKNAATYSHQLNVVLPLITGLLSIPKLPDHIRGKLNELRDHRNNVAHRGKPENPIDSKHAGELMCAAIFGFQYMRYVEKRLSATT